MNHKNLLIIIRSAKERTESLCKKIIASQSPNTPVEIIYEKPFKKALETCFEKAIESESKWLITVDADMLLLPNAINTLVSHAEMMPENYIQLQGKIKDKITDNIRKGGPRIYRVSLLHKLLELSRSIEDSIRPESFVITSLGERGYPSRYISYITCFHDYEQYYKDLYRKAFVHAHKHQDLAGKLIQYSIENKSSDTDYQVILQAVMDGLENSGPVSIDRDLFQEKSEMILKQLGMNEKEPFDDSVNPTPILDSLQKNQPIENDGVVHFSDQPSTEKRISNNFIRIIKRDGLIKGSLHGIGIFLVRIGRKLQMHR